MAQTRSILVSVVTGPRRRTITSGAVRPHDAHLARLPGERRGALLRETQHRVAAATILSLHSLKSTFLSYRTMPMVSARAIRGQGPFAIAWRRAFDPDKNVQTAGAIDSDVR